MSARVYFLIGFTVLVALLAWQFPQGIDSDHEKARLVYLSIWVAVISGSSLLTHRFPKGKMVQYALAWLALLLLVMVGYQFTR